MADGVSALLQVLQIVRIEPVENVGDDDIEAGRGEELPIRSGRGGKAVGHADALCRELANHFPQRGVFSADGGDVVDPDLIKPFDERRGWEGSRRRAGRFAIEGGIHISYE